MSAERGKDRGGVPLKGSYGALSGEGHTSAAEIDTGAGQLSMVRKDGITSKMVFGFGCLGRRITANRSADIVSTFVDAMPQTLNLALALA